MEIPDSSWKLYELWPVEPVAVNGGGSGMTGDAYGLIDPAAPVLVEAIPDGQHDIDAGQIQKVTKWLRIADQWAGVLVMGMDAAVNGIFFIGHKKTLPLK